MYSCCVTGHGVDIEIDGEKKLKRLLLLKEFLAETIATFIFVVSHFNFNNNFTQLNSL